MLFDAPRKPMYMTASYWAMFFTAGSSRYKSEIFCSLWKKNRFELYKNCIPITFVVLQCLCYYTTITTSLSSYFRLMIWLDCKHFVWQNLYSLSLQSFKGRNMLQWTQISFCVSYFIRVIMWVSWFACSTKWLQTVFDM